MLTCTYLTTLYSGVMVLDRGGVELEEQMLDFASRVGKVVIAIPDSGNAIGATYFHR